MRGLHPTWSRQPLRLLIARDRFGTSHLLLRPDDGRDLSNAAGGPRVTVRRHDAGEWPDLMIPLELPLGGVVRIQDTRNDFFDRGFVRYVVVADPEIWASGTDPFVVW